MSQALFAIGLAAAVAASSPQPQPASAPAAASAPKLSASAVADARREADLTRQLDEASKLLDAHKPNDAIAKLDAVVAAYEKQFAGVRYRVYSARGESESAAYIEMARKEGKDSLIVSPNWAYAYTMKGYALIDLHQIADARAAFEKAIALAPHNAIALTEKGTTYQFEKNWPEAEKVFTVAVDAARLYSPPALRKAEMAKALHGVGYVFVEEGRYDDAVKMYEEIQRLDPKDRTAQKELDYIARRRATDPRNTAASAAASGARTAKTARSGDSAGH